jgi:hypothetical protein
MAQDRVDPDLVEWRPEWQGEDLEYYNRLRGQLEPSISMLRAVRELLGMSQTEAAEILMTSQSNVSKMEARSDTGVSVLSRLVRSKGGTLRIVADFGGEAREFSL